MIQHSLLFQDTQDISLDNLSYREKLISLLTSDLDFHDEDSSYASHDFHSFPAKFPPQLPRKFIQGLTSPGDTILDPMSGSGTTILEAVLSNRKAIGFDIDPLALKLSKVKTTSLDPDSLRQAGYNVLKKAHELVTDQEDQLRQTLANRWDTKTKSFVDYWFSNDIQLELLALLTPIQDIEDVDIRNFLELICSAIIITKSGGVSLAFDLAHTRPHRAKVVYDTHGNLIFGQDYIDAPSKRTKLLTKKLRSPFAEFKKRLQQNLTGLLPPTHTYIKPTIRPGNAQNLPLEAESVDLIITSPPYAANAIDYMRAHKFSLVWLGYPIDDLSTKRKTYIGGDSTADFDFAGLPAYTTDVVNAIAKLDAKKGKILHRYYSEMTSVLKQVHRVLRPNRAAIFVVGSSIMRQRDTETGDCLADIGKQVGFEVPKIGIRHLDRNRRMMPAGMTRNQNSQIQQRMHEEFVIGFYKPIPAVGQ